VRSGTIDPPDPAHSYFVSSTGRHPAFEVPFDPLSWTVLVSMSHAYIPASILETNDCSWSVSAFAARLGAPIVNSKGQSHLSGQDAVDSFVESSNNLYCIIRVTVSTIPSCIISLIHRRSREARTRIPIIGDLL
jgi:hypothetical protein